MARIQRNKSSPTKAELESELALYAKLAGRAGGQELAGAKEAAESKALKLVGYPGSTSSLRVVNNALEALGFLGGMAFETGELSVMTFRGVAVFVFGLLQEGTGITMGVQLSQLALGPTKNAAEITSNRKDYGALHSVPTTWWRLKASKIVAIFGIESKEFLTASNHQEGKIYLLTNFGTNAIDLVGENTECATETDRLIIRANTGTNNFEGTIAAAALTEIKEITNFRFLYPGSKVTDAGGVIKAGTTINSTNEAAKTAIMSEAATGEHAKESMTASYANITTLGVNETLWLGYDTIATRWRVVGGPSG